MCLTESGLGGSSLPLPGAGAAIVKGAGPQTHAPPLPDGVQATHLPRERRVQGLGFAAPWWAAGGRSFCLARLQAGPRHWGSGAGNARVWAWAATFGKAAGEMLRPCWEVTFWGNTESDQREGQAIRGRWPWQPAAHLVSAAAAPGVWGGPHSWCPSEPPFTLRVLITRPTWHLTSRL